jgi:hypothetical protein
MPTVICRRLEFKLRLHKNGYNKITVGILRITPHLTDTYPTPKGYPAGLCDEDVVCSQGSESFHFYFNYLSFN